MVLIVKYKGGGMKQLQRYITDEPYYEAIRKNGRCQAERDNQYSRNTIWIQTRQINYTTDICIENATGKAQRQKQRAPHGFRRH